MNNTGIKIFTTLIEYDSITDLPTGRSKPNLPTDPHYIAPISDPSVCPIGSVQELINVIVDFPDGYDVEFKITYGSAFATRSAAGTWQVPWRNYSGVLFNVSVKPIDAIYACYVKYIDYGNVTKIKRYPIIHNGITLIPGPYFKLQEIKILQQGVAFSDDFNNSFET